MSEFDLAVIGGGAAGFFGAIAFGEASPGSRIVIIEKTNAVLGKVKISGGGRCNVTHACYEPKAFTKHYPRGEKNLIGPFHRWGATETIDWFASKGVELKTEADGRMFPTTDQSTTIIECLLEAATAAGVEIYYRCDVETLFADADGWRVCFSEGPDISAKTVLLASGGVRNGVGARLTEHLGHEVIPAAPSLFTFKIRDPRLMDLSGVSAPVVRAAIPELSLETRGPCLITHWGLSGPAILKLSALGARALADRDYCFDVTINWLDLSREEVEAALQKEREASPKKRVRSGVRSIDLPNRLWAQLVDFAEISHETTWSNLSKRGRLDLVQQLVASQFSVDGKSMNKEEFVTAGGINLREVNFKTMESKLVPRLYFAGEVLDIDGITGGFNFQAAWTTGRIAGESAAAAISDPC